MENKIIKSQKKQFLENYINNLQSIINKTILSCQKYKLYDILGANEVTICITTLENIYAELVDTLAMIKANVNENEINKKISNAKTEFILILKNFGTESFNIKRRVY